MHGHTGSRTDSCATPMGYYFAQANPTKIRSKQMSLQLFAAATDHAIAWGVPSVLALLSGALLYAIWQVVKALQAQIDGLRADMNSLRSDVNELRSDMSTLRQEIRTEMNASLSAFRQEMRAEMSAFRQEMRAEMSAFRQEIRAEMSEGFQRMDDKIDALTDRVEQLEIREWSS